VESHLVGHAVETPDVLRVDSHGIDLSGIFPKYQKEVRIFPQRLFGECGLFQILG